MGEIVTHGNGTIVLSGNYGDGMRIERTRDMTLVRAALSHPAIWPHIREDGTDMPEQLDHDGVHWLAVSDPEPAGVFMVAARGVACYEIHTCLLPRIWGKGAAQAARLVLAHLFGDMGGEKVITNVPAYNRHALRFAKSSGMQVEGVNRASYLRGGVMVDQIMLGITKGEWKCLYFQQ